LMHSYYLMYNAYICITPSPGFVSKRLYRTTILVDKELWKRFKIKAIQEGKSASSLLEELIKKALAE
jgi:hypothetical protein